MVNRYLCQYLIQYFQHCESSTITTLITPFQIQYTILCLSKDKDQYLMIGPYLETPIDEHEMYPIMKHLHLSLDHIAQLKFYYQSLPLLESTSLFEILYTVHETITSNSLQPKNHSHSQYSPIVKKALTFIDLNLSSPLSVKQLAHEVGLSPDYLTRLFKKELGMTVIHYMNQKRIYRSLKLLVTTTLSIEEIGDLVGLGNTSYFHALFKKQIGLSPNQYRKQFKLN